MSKLLAYETLHNIRDLGGMRSGNGQTIISGKLIRSGHLSTDNSADIGKLSALADTVVDFRSELERMENPDAEIPGVVFFHIPILESLAEGITREEKTDQKAFALLAEDPDAAYRHMIRMYADFVKNDYALSQYRRFLQILLEEHEKAVLWHCTAGKDRAGIASVIVQEILGISKEDILEDYLKTNEYLKSDIDFLIGFVKKQAGLPDDTADRALWYFFAADKDFLDAFYEAVYDLFGDFRNFLFDGLKLTDDDLSELRRKYLS